MGHPVVTSEGTILQVYEKYPNSYGDWVTVHPPINGISRFWGGKPPPINAANIFPTDHIVTICMKTRPKVGKYKGFKARVLDTKQNKVSLPTETATDVQIISQTPAIITSPNYPQKYPNDVNQCWITTPSKGFAVQFNFTAFDVNYIFNLEPS